MKLFAAADINNDENEWFLRIEQCVQFRARALCRSVYLLFVFEPARRRGGDREEQRAGRRTK